MGTQEHYIVNHAGDSEGLKGGEGTLSKRVRLHLSPCTDASIFQLRNESCFILYRKVELGSITGGHGEYTQNHETPLLHRFYCKSNMLWLELIANT